MWRRVTDQTVWCNKSISFQVPDCWCCRVGVSLLTSPTLYYPPQYYFPLNLLSQFFYRLEALQVLLVTSSHFVVKLNILCCQDIALAHHKFNNSSCYSLPVLSCTQFQLSRRTDYFSPSHQIVRLYLHCSFQNQTDSSPSLPPSELLPLIIHLQDRKPWPEVERTRKRTREIQNQVIRNQGKNQNRTKGNQRNSVPSHQKPEQNQHQKGSVKEPGIARTRQHQEKNQES